MLVSENSKSKRRNTPNQLCVTLHGGSGVGNMGKSYALQINILCIVKCTHKYVQTEARGLSGFDLTIVEQKQTDVKNRYFGFDCGKIFRRFWYDP